MQILLDGLQGREFPRSAYASTYAIWSPRGFPVVLGNAGDPKPVVAAIQLASSGRVVAFGHEAIPNGCCSTGDEWDTLVVNAFRWLAGADSKRRNVRIGAIQSVGNGLSQVAAALTAATKATASPLTVTASFVDLDAFAAGGWAHYDIMWIDTYVDYTAKQVQGLLTFAQKPGKGLIVGGHAWYWGYSHPNANIFTDLAVNRILWPLGLVVTTDAQDGFQAAPSSPPPNWIYYNAYVSVSAVIDSQKTGATLGDPEIVSLAKRTIMDLAQLLPPRSAATASGLTGVWSTLDKVRTSSSLVIGPNSPFNVAQASIGDTLKVLLDVAAIRQGDTTNLKPSPSAAAYPGALPPKTPTTTVTVTVNGTYDRAPYNLAYAGWGSPVWRSTGLYAPPGGVVTVTLVTRSAADKGLQVQIGAHTDDLTSKDTWLRVPYIVSRTALRSVTTQAGNPMGGLIFVLVPVGATLGSVQISFTGVVPSPYFRLGVDSLAQWTKIRKNPGIWAELDSGKFIIMLPSKAIRTLADPVSLLTHWNKVMDADAYLANMAGRSRAERFLVDADIDGGWMHAGYPIMAYDDPVVYNEMLNLDRLKTQGAWGPYHELGHNHQWGDMMFHGTTESSTNLFTIYALEQTGVPQTAWDNWESVSPSGRAAARAQYLANGANWDRDWDVWVALDTYLQLKEAFGWGFYRRMYQTYMNLPQPLQDDNVQTWIQTSSQVAGVNLVPFYTKWGFPVSSSTIKRCSSLPVWKNDPMNP